MVLIITLIFFIRRAKRYQSYGRNQTEEQAKEIDINMLELIEDWGYSTIEGTMMAPQRILKQLGIA